MTAKTERQHYIEGEATESAMQRLSVSLKGVEGTRENTHFKNKYAHIDDIWLEIRSRLWDYGLICSTKVHEGLVVLTVWHVDGAEPYVSSLPITLVADPQKVGSQITYYRRYLLVMAFNITGAVDDDDGQYANRAETLSESQMADLHAKADELFGDGASDMLKRMADKIFNAKKVADIRADCFNTAISALEKRHAAMQEAQ